MCLPKSNYADYLSKTAMTKVMAGIKLTVALANVADV